MHLLTLMTTGVKNAQTYMATREIAELREPREAASIDT
jgi:hypothetical protein